MVVLFPDDLIRQATTLVALLGERGLKLATAESCTGGLIAGCLTELPGVSAVFERGFVTYSNEAKNQSIGVDASLIAAHGAVSAEVAEAMAEGALSHSLADVALSVTGIAGPDGGSAEKPVGLVYIGFAGKGRRTRSFRFVFDGDRTTIRLATAKTALGLLEKRLNS